MTRKDAPKGRKQIEDIQKLIINRKGECCGSPCETQTATSEGLFGGASTYILHFFECKKCGQYPQKYQILKWEAMVPICCENCKESATLYDGCWAVCSRDCIHTLIKKGYEIGNFTPIEKYGNWIETGKFWGERTNKAPYGDVDENDIKKFQEEGDAAR